MVPVHKLSTWRTGAWIAQEYVSRLTPLPAQVRFSASAWGRVVVVHPRSVVFSENASIKRVSFLCNRSKINKTIPTEEQKNHRWFWRKIKEPKITVCLQSFLYVMLTMHSITLRSPCDGHPSKTSHYIGKYGVHITFLIFARNIDCGCFLEPPHWGGSNEHPQSIFGP